MDCILWFSTLMMYLRKIFLLCIFKIQEMSKWSEKVIVTKNWLLDYSVQYFSLRILDETIRQTIRHKCNIFHAIRIYSPFPLRLLNYFTGILILIHLEGAAVVFVDETDFDNFDLLLLVIVVVGFCSGSRWGFQSWSDDVWCFFLLGLGISWWLDSVGGWFFEVWSEFDCHLVVVVVFVCVCQYICL